MSPQIFRDKIKKLEFGHTLRLGHMGEQYIEINPGT